MPSDMYIYSHGPHELKIHNLKKLRLKPTIGWCKVNTTAYSKLQLWTNKRQCKKIRGYLDWVY